MRVLVIGGSGFTGQRVLAACPREWTLLCLTRSPEASEVVEGLGATAVPGDLDQSSTLRAALETARPDAVICVASLGFGHGPSLVRSIAEWGTPRTIFTSTTAVFTKLEPPTKKVRLAAEQVIRASPLPSTIVRPTMIYGRPGDRNIERLLRWLARAPVVFAPGGVDPLQQPVHVDDLAATVVRAVERPEAVGGAFDVPGPAPFPFSDLVRHASAAVGQTGRVIPVPHRALRGVVAAQERLLARPRLKVEQIDRLLEDKAFDPDPAAAVLGHTARPFVEGVRAEAQLLGLVS